MWCKPGTLGSWQICRQSIPIQSRYNLADAKLGIGYLRSPSVPGLMWWHQAQANNCTENKEKNYFCWKDVGCTLSLRWLKKKSRRLNSRNIPILVLLHKGVLLKNVQTFRARHLRLICIVKHVVTTIFKQWPPDNHNWPNSP